MLYLFNKVIPNSKKLEYSLRILYGINNYQSKKICKTLGINPQITLKKIKKNHVNKLINYLNKNIKVESLLKKSQKERVNSLLNIKLIRIIRARNGLPVRGQRTHTNAKTIKYLKRGIKRKKKLSKRKKKNDKKFNINKNKSKNEKKKRKN
jgi:small subunit ribosomal protein S13